MGSGKSGGVDGLIRGYLGGLAWTLDPANRGAAIEILIENMPEIQPRVAGAVMTRLLSPKSGLTPGAAMLMEGVKTVLALRSKYGSGGTLSNPEKYIDLQYLEAAKR